MQGHQQSPTGLVDVPNYQVGSPQHHQEPAALGLEQPNGHKHPTRPSNRLGPGDFDQQLCLDCGFGADMKPDDANPLAYPGSSAILFDNAGRLVHTAVAPKLLLWLGSCAVWQCQPNLVEKSLLCWCFVRNVCLGVDDFGICVFWRLAVTGLDIEDGAAAPMLAHAVAASDAALGDFLTGVMDGSVACWSSWREVPVNVQGSMLWF
ncbi:hypothetical protein Nepgr_008084 [Nepenthes gracilis]|uniref:Uncharacterized protein n=1 Tax=Nepenthes gracilis TaxID=150966 RepID=A0AAD3S894_NEPGR|nr:hypothetical protein Nepgr_008084 [Nepenthes gracilis]